MIFAIYFLCLMLQIQQLYCCLEIAAGTDLSQWSFFLCIRLRANLIISPKYVNLRKFSESDLKIILNKRDGAKFSLLDLETVISSKYF